MVDVNQGTGGIADDALVSIEQGNTVRLVFKFGEKYHHADISKETAVQLGWTLTVRGVEAHKTAENPLPDFPFDTDMTEVISMLGNQSGGHLIMRFLTPLGVYLTTTVGPNLCAMLASQLNSSLAQMTKAPDDWLRPGMMGSPLKGKTKATDTINYFGQDYPREIVEVVGILIIRANLLESALIRLLAKVSEVSMQRAEAMFFSTQNNRARLDLIRAQTAVSSLSEGRKKDIEKQLGIAQDLANQRNLLVHGEWSFKSDKFQVKERKALPASKGQQTIVSHKSISDLASRFHDLAVAIDLIVVN